jgi:hypothetical protein
MNIKELIDRADMDVDKAYRLAVSYFQPLKNHYHTVRNERVRTNLAWYNSFFGVVRKYNIVKTTHPLEIIISRNGSDEVYVNIIFERGGWEGYYESGCSWEPRKVVSQASFSFSLTSLYDENSVDMVKFAGRIMAIGKEYTK